MAVVYKPHLVPEVHRVQAQRQEIVQFALEICFYALHHVSQEMGL